MTNFSNGELVVATIPGVVNYCNDFYIGVDYYTNSKKQESVSFSLDCLIYPDTNNDLSPGDRVVLSVTGVTDISNGMRVIADDESYFYVDVSHVTRINPPISGTIMLSADVVSNSRDYVTVRIGEHEVELTHKSINKAIS